MRIKFGPSIIAGDWTDLRKTIKQIESAESDFIHIDVMDGLFVKNITFGPMIVSAISKLTSLPLYVHLMIVEPIRYITGFIFPGVQLISFHIEAVRETGVEETILKIRKNNCKVGIALNPETPVENIEPYIEETNQILVMSVNPGFSGQEFQKISLSKIKKLRGYAKDIAVDGGLNKKTIPLVLEAGATTLCIGSFFFNDKNAPNYLRKIKGE